MDSCINYTWFVVCGVAWRRKRRWAGSCAHMEERSGGHTKMFATHAKWLDKGR